MWPADTDYLPQVTTVMCIETVKLCFSVFCPGFQKGRVPFEKGTFSAVNGPSKGHN